MKKTSKILSLLVALCMAVTILSGLTVFAADPFELVSYDADADFVTLDFNQAIDLENSVIVLKKGGEHVPFTIAKADMQSAVQTKGSSRYTYLVKPEAGMELFADYKITFWDVKSSDGTSTLEQSAMTFTVYEMATQQDLVNIKPYSYPLGAWVKDAETGNLSLTDVEIKTSNNMTAQAHAGTLFGADKEAGNTLPNASGSSPSQDMLLGVGTPSETDYTVKLTFKTDDRIGRFNAYLGMGRNLTNNHGGNDGHDSTNLAMEGYEVGKPAAQKMNLYLYDGSKSYDAETGVATGGRYTAESLAGNDRLTKTYNFIEGVEMKLSSKEGVLRGFINGNKVLDAPSKGLAGYPYFSFRTIGGTTNAETGAANTHCSAEISGFQVTQSVFEEVEDLDWPIGYVPEEPEEAEKPEIVLDWNADLDFFTVDFAEEIASLDAVITQAGEIIPATVSNATLSTADPANIDRYTWKVEPADGITRDIPYTVTISNVKDAEGNKVLSTWSKTFKVEVIDEGITYPSDPATKANHYSKGGVASQLPGGGIKFQNSGETLTKNMFAYAIGADTDATKSIGSATSAPNAVYTQEAQYTVKATFKVGGATAHEIGIGHRYSIHSSYGYDHNWSRGTGVYVDVWPARKVNEETGRLESGNTGGITMYSTKYIDGAPVKNMQKQDANSENGPLNNLTPSTGIQLKLAMKGDNTNVYVNGGKAMDNINYGERGCLDFFWAGKASSSSGAYKDNAYCEITDIVITKAVHADVYGEYFTAGEVEVEEGAIAGNDTVSLSTVVKNNTLNDKAIFAACAFYNAAGAMTNLVISEVETATTGETPIEFPNAETFGATFAKIFIWDAADSLNAWFPAIEVE